MTESELNSHGPGLTQALTPKGTPRSLKPRMLENGNSWLLPPPRHGMRHLGVQSICATS